jgi:uncharacterized protein (TIGR00369 family)
VGNNKTWLDQADKIILEVNTWQNPALEGMHDIYYGTELPPYRKPIPLLQPHDRIGEPYLRCDPDKVIAVVHTDLPDRNNRLRRPTRTPGASPATSSSFLQHEVKQGRLPKDLLPLQSGVGNIANAVLAGLNDGPFRNLTAFTEVLQDGMLDMLRSGKLASVGHRAVAQPEATADFNDRTSRFYRERIVLRPQEISNHPELIRRLGLIAMNGMIEADIYGNVNSTTSWARQHHERHRRLGRLRAQRLPVDLHDALGGQGRFDLVHRAHGLARGPHRARRAGDRHRAGPGRPARPVADPARAPDHRALRAPGLPARAAGLHGACAARVLGQHTPHLLDDALGWHSGTPAAGHGLPFAVIGGAGLGQWRFLETGSAPMSLWKQAVSIDVLHAIHVDTAVARLGIEFLEVGDDFIRARVPVNTHTRQPYGLLHGGVSVVLAETLGSCGAAFTLPEGYRAVGLDINANHLRGATSGWVTGIARPVHVGRTTQVWQIELTNDAGELTCVSRITMAVLAPKN